MKFVLVSDLQQHYDVLFVMECSTLCPITLRRDCLMTNYMQSFVLDDTLLDNISNE